MLYLLIGLTIAWVSFWVGKHYRDSQLIRLLGDQLADEEDITEELTALLLRARRYLEQAPLEGVMDVVDNIDRVLELLPDTPACCDPTSETCCDASIRRRYALPEPSDTGGVKD